LSPDV
jgi:hypothetical protein